MLGITLTSERFERLLFKVENDALTSKHSTSAVLTSFKSQTYKKNNIVIISNGIEQTQTKLRIKKYVFQDQQISEQNSQLASFSHQKKHLIKKQKKEDPDYSVKRQKNDRNVVSNIIHHLMKHSMTAVSNQWLLKLINQKRIGISIEKFREILERKDTMCKTYITNKHLNLLWNDLQEGQFSQLMRIISRVFLQNYSFLTILNGNKLNKESKLIHYNGRRQLLRFLNKIK